MKIIRNGEREKSMPKGKDWIGKEERNARTEKQKKNANLLRMSKVDERVA